MFGSERKGRAKVERVPKQVPAKNIMCMVARYHIQRWLMLPDRSNWHNCYHQGEKMEMDRT